MSMAALDYIQRKGWEFRTQGGELVLKECPFCQDTNFHFYLSQEEGNPFYCHKCQERGNLITLKKHLGDWEPLKNGIRSSQERSKTAVKQAFSPKVGVKHGLNEKMALRAHEKLLEDTEALAYVTEGRGLALETVQAPNSGSMLTRKIPDG